METATIVNVVGGVFILVLGPYLYFYPPSFLFYPLTILIPLWLIFPAFFLFKTALAIEHEAKGIFPEHEA